MCSGQAAEVSDDPDDGPAINRFLMVIYRSNPNHPLVLFGRLLFRSASELTDGIHSEFIADSLHWGH